jgi:hypothetical protein
VAKLDNSVFWLGSDARGNGIVYRNQGYNAQRVSTHAIEWQIQQYGVLNDAIGYSYQQDGHSFYVLVFPTAQATWVFDVATGAWHERAYWDGVQYRRHRSNCQANFAGQVLVGDWENGRVYAFDPEVYQDGNDLQRWLRSWRALPTGQNTLKRTAHHALQLDCESGGSNLQVLESAIPLFSYGPFTSTAGWTAQPGVALLLSSGRILITYVFIPDVSHYGYFTFSSPANKLVSLQIQFIAAFTGKVSIRIGSAPLLSDYGIYSLNNFTGAELDSGIVTINFLPTSGTSYITVFSEKNDLSLTAPDVYVVSMQASYINAEPLNPEVMLRWSDDGSHTWSNEHWASMGKLGEYGKRVIWRRLGMTTKLRDRVYEVSGTDPVKIAIMGAELSVTPTSA